MNYAGARLELSLLLIHYSSPLFSLVTSKATSLEYVKSLLNTILCHRRLEQTDLLACCVTDNKSSDSFLCVCTFLRYSFYLPLVSLATSATYCLFFFFSCFPSLPLSGGRTFFPLLDRPAALLPDACQVAALWPSISGSSRQGREALGKMDIAADRLWGRLPIPLHP